MAQVKFTGLCGGTIKKISAKTQKEYFITEFSDLSGERMSVFQVFGDLGLPKDLTPREYVFEAGVTGLSGVKLLNGAKPK